jgi:glycosyltransferase involved in cell wall biosynthesis
MSLAAQSEELRNASAPAGRRVRLMLFTDSFVHGGTERQLVTTLQFLDPAKYEVSVGCLKKRGPFLPDVEALGIPVFEFPINSLHNAGTLRSFRRLAAHLKAERVDIVHAFDYYTNLFAVPAARWAGVPVIIASRRNLAHGRTALERLALRAACSLAHRVLANSAAAARTCVGFTAADFRKVDVIPNAIDPAAYEPEQSILELRRARGWPGDELCVGVVAALRPEKGHRTFLRAAAIVAARHSETRFILIGDGPQRPALEALARELGVAGRVIFAGDRSDVPECLAALDLAVQPSDFESLPNAVLEAMAAARPVVATRVGGTPELIEEGRTGYLVPAGDAETMAVRILDLLREPARRRAFGNAGRARVERWNSPQRIRAQFDSLYERMVRQRLPAARVLQISNYPPPVCGWSIHTQLVERELAARGADSRVMDIGPGRTLEGRGCETVMSGFDYARKLLRYRRMGFTFHAHLNGDSWKGYLLALAAVLLGRLSSKPAVVTFHAGPSQIYFPRSRGFWFRAFQLLFRSSGNIICNHEPVKRLIEAYGVPPGRVHPIPAFSSQYQEEIPAPLPPRVEEFLSAHAPLLFSYSLFRPEFTMEALFGAFAELRREEFTRAGLIVAGPQEVPAEFAEQLGRLCASESVLFPGNLPHAEFLTAVARSDVFVRTHLRDGVCTSVLEALGLGVPVVAAEDGHRPASVVTYAPGDAADLLRKLRDVLSDLSAARSRIRPPEVENHLEREVRLLLAAAGGGTGTAPLAARRPEASGEARG